MNNDILAGNWKQFQGKMLEQWGILTDDDIDADALSGFLARWAPAARGGGC